MIERKVRVFFYGSFINRVPTRSVGTRSAAFSHGGLEEGPLVQTWTALH